MTFDIVEPTLVFIRTFQKVGSFVGCIMFILGIFIFLYSFKNPLKRRLAYVLTLLGPALLLMSIHGVVFIAHYVFSQPIQPDDTLGLHLFEPKLDDIGRNIYTAIQHVSYPVMAFVLLLGMGVYHHASRIPGRKRIAFGIFAGIPFLLMIIQLGPTIFSVLLS